MSLGWQTESALVPRAGKAIDVDSTSMVALKALVYAKEQQKINGTATNIRKKRDRVIEKTDNDRSLKDRKVDRSKNEEKRSDVSQTVLQSLKAKSEVYEMIRNKDSTSKADRELIDKYSRSDGSCLVDFRQSTANASDNKYTTSSNSNSTVGNSSAYKLHGNEEEPGNTSSQWTWSTGKATGDVNEFQASYESKMALQALLEKHKKLSENEQYEPSSSLSRFDDSTRQYSRNDEDAERDASHSSLGTISHGGRVKSQWEKTLKGSTREFLDQVHSETLNERKANSSSGSSIVITSRPAESDTIGNDIASTVVDVQIVHNVGNAPKSAKELRRELIKKQQQEKGMM